MEKYLNTEVKSLLEILNIILSLLFQHYYLLLSNNSNTHFILNISFKMQFILVPSILMALATTITALPSPSNPITGIQARNDQAATLNIAPDPNCRDYNYVAAADGECYYMGGNSVAVWETQDDCRGKFRSCTMWRM
jgi:hypothetical protein